jgi:glyceraldehyde 3-phosphate dehydrogenase
MPIRIGINGFGRMGRLALRAGWGHPGLSFVHINEIAADAVTAAHLLEFDSVHGRWNKSIAASDQSIVVGGTPITLSSAATPGDVAWAAQGVDVVLECSGKFRTVDKLESYRRAGVKTVIVAAPVKEKEALNIVVGVNDSLYDPSQHWLLTAASCTTNLPIVLLRS